MVIYSESFLKYKSMFSDCINPGNSVWFYKKKKRHWGHWQTLFSMFLKINLTALSLLFPQTATENIYFAKSRSVSMPWEWERSNWSELVWLVQSLTWLPKSYKTIALKNHLQQNCLYFKAISKFIIVLTGSSTYGEAETLILLKTCVTGGWL